MYNVRKRRLDGDVQRSLAAVQIPGYGRSLPRVLGGAKVRADT